MPDTMTIAVDASSQFVPNIGTTTLRLGEHFLKNDELPSDGTFENLHVDRALSIMSKCGDPKLGERKATSLVIGYVQSGKTISMATLASVARDNGYKIIIVLAGITENLVNQSRTRFESCLRPASSSWVISDSVDEVRGAQDLTRLRALVQDWRRGNTPAEYERTVFITVMKNYTHLKRVANLLRDAKVGDLPTLIIDDEADQASLNLAPRSANGSTTYRHIDSLRQVLRNHAYVQYTATPQAPLLISILDSLSPDTVTLLDAGAAYCGGRVFFQPATSPLKYVRRIPAAEIQSILSASFDPPETLLKSLRIFLLGVAVGILNGEMQNPKKHRSMLVHPSRLKDDHKRFFGWVASAKARLVSELSAAAASGDWQEVTEEFLPEYEDLVGTNAGLPELSKLLGTLSWALTAHVDTVMVNSENESEVKWGNWYAHILVGGDKVNRGYTVEGLTVTYMARSMGDGTVDTIQQRARFFGYKASYIGLCRVYLETDVLAAFRSYVHHEEEMRKHLKQFENRSLNHWKRVFYLEPGLHATRRAVINDPVVGVHVGMQEWFKMAAPHANSAVVARNAALVNGFAAARTKQAHPKDNRKSPKHRHVACTVTLHEMLSELLAEFSGGELNDIAGLFATTCVLANLAEKAPETLCQIVFMDELTPRKRSTRGKADPGSVNVHSGEGSTQDTGYVGDAAIHDDTTLTVQVHRLNVHAAKGVFADVYSLAVWFPDWFKAQRAVVEPTNVAG